MYTQSKLQTVSFEEMGVAFKIPSGWSSQIDGDYMFLKHTTISGLLVVFESRSKSTSELMVLANNGIREEGVHLTSTNDFRIVAENRVEGYYEGVFMHTIVKAYAIGVINNLGSGLSILAITEPKDFGEIIKGEAEKLASSVTFEKLKLSKQTKRWNNRLIGKRLNYFNTQTNTSFGSDISGIADRETLELFNDGSFYYNQKNGSIVNGASVNSGDKLSGAYRIITIVNITYLQLFCANETLEFKLTRSNSNHTLLNGKRYLVEDL